MSPPASVAGSEPLLRQLELTITRKLDGLVHGDHQGLVPGAGSDSGDGRRYEPGDDVRRIDWNLTARSGDVQVRTTIADRELETWFVVDGSASLDYGTAQHEKRDLALAVVAAFGFITARAGNRVAAVVFDADHTRVIPPTAGRDGVLSLLAGLNRRPRSTGGSPALATALRRVRHLAGRRGLVVVVSDLLDPGDWPSELRALAARHDVVVAHLTDPREDDIPPVGLLTLVDPETGRRVEVQTSSRRFRDRYAQGARGRREAAIAGVRSARADLLQVSTDRDWLADVVKHVREAEASAMSFLHPGRLWLFVAVAGVVGAYVIVHLRRRRAIQRWTSSHLHASIAPDRLGWRRHVAPVLASVALALVVLGLAQPVQAQQVARDEGVVVLAVDVSASMTATDIAPSRIEAAIEGASKFVDEIPDGIQVGLVAFDGTARVLVDPTTDHTAVVDAVQTLRTGPRTATGEGIATSLDSITSTLSDAALAEDQVPASVVLLSDGYTTVGRPAEQAAEEAADLGIPVTTIAYGTPTGTVAVQGQVVDVPADTTTMQAVADVTGGRYFEATTAGELDDAYTDIRTVVGYTTEPREVSRAFFGAGLLVLLGSTPFAFVWAARAL